MMCDCFHERISCFVLFFSERKVNTVRPDSQGMGFHVFGEAGKPQRTGYTGSSGKQICVIERIDGEQPGKRIASDSSPDWFGSDPPFSFRKNLLCQLVDVCVSASGKRITFWKDS